MDCKECENQYWKQMYITAAQRFDTVLARIIALFVVIVVIMMICVFATILICIRTHRFIENFEYVEETEVEITQDDGINAAVVGSDNEVNINGTENNN